MLTSAMVIVWVLTTAGVWSNPDGTVYPPSRFGIAKNIFLGKMNCAGRLLDIDHFQTWCTKNGKVTINEVTDLTQKAITLELYDQTTGEKDAVITWLVAPVEGNPNTIAYEIAYKIDGIEKPMITGMF